MTLAIITAPPETPDLFGTAPSDLVPDDRHDSTPTEARERADRLRAGIVQYSQMRQDIADAFAGRDWVALGYDSWYAYVEGEFGEQLARLDRGEQREAIGDLRAQGMSVRQIASATGMPRETVRRNVAADPNGSPEKVTGSDGRQHPASRPKPTPAPTPEQAEAPSTAPVGSGPDLRDEILRLLGPDSVPAPTPEQAEAQRMEEQRVQIVDRARRRAPRLVPEIRDLITEVMSGMNLGETDLITPQTIADIRALVDALEARMEATR